LNVRRVERDDCVDHVPRRTRKMNEERRAHLALPVLEFADVKLVFVFDEPGLPKQLPQFLCPPFRA
jgi:hypothetical protein